MYKCELNSEWSFSDQPCAPNAEKIELKVYQPKSEDIDKQRKLTKRNTEDSQYYDLDVLRAKNDALKANITQLLKQRDVELKVLNKSIYNYSDTYVATSEYGLFRKIDEVNAKYRMKIERVNDEIKHNEVKMFNLKSLIDAQH